MATLLVGTLQPSFNLRRQRCTLSEAFNIVGTAGHIDHGKSALVRSLTGTDPDRLQEEQERGITIDLGFAHLDLGDAVRVGFIDVPGHERFVKNMLAGIGGIDAVLLVVAADESIMPQTREHLAICELLGVRSGVVAITKCDLVDAEITDLVELEVRDLLADSALADAPIVKTSAEDGRGLDTLRDRLAEVLNEVTAHTDTGNVRLPVDRVFTVRGFGTVVTGTLLSGSIGPGDELELLPAGTTVSVRGTQVYDEPVDRAIAGQRTAINLQGIEVDRVQRGYQLISHDSMSTTYMLDVRLNLLPGHELKQQQRVRFHHGAAEILCRVAVLDADAVGEGGSALVQLRLESPYACYPGDRFVIRRYSPMLTIGGGTVIDNLPAKHRPHDAHLLEHLTILETGSADERLATIVRRAGTDGIGAAELLQRWKPAGPDIAEVAARLAAADELVVTRGDPLHLIDAARFEELRGAILGAIDAFHRNHPLQPAMAKRELVAALPRGLPNLVFDSVIEHLRDQGALRSEADGFALDSHGITLTAAQERLRDALLELYEGAAWAPPSLREAAQQLGSSASEVESVFHLLLRDGGLVRLRDDLVLHAMRLDELITQLQTRHAAGDEFSVGDFKNWTGVSRKHAIPLLEYLDQRRITRRVGNKRVRV